MRLAEQDRQHGRVASAPSRWTINGRFVGQPATGVQRYAREVVLALDGLVKEGHPAAKDLDLGLALPPDLPDGASVPGDLPRLRRRGWGRGHAWEQSALRGEPHLLSLCNTGPVLASGQIVCIHDANVWLQPDSYSAPFRILYRALLPVLGHRAAGVATVSAFSADRLAEHGIAPRERITVLPNGHEHALRWDAARSTLDRTRFGRRPFVLLLGSRARHKNVGLVLGLAAELDRAGIDVVVAGGGAAIFQDGRDEADAANIVRLGTVSDDDLAFLFAHALVLAFPSLTEGFGLPVLEAMALGCPVVSSDAASLPEIAGDAALFAVPGDSEAWLRLVLRCAADEDLRADMAARGRRRASAFSWRQTAIGYCDLMRRAGG